jgi:putative FmdB family regulatory protein
MSASLLEVCGSEEEPVPTYQYACTACDERLEVVQSFTDDALTECPACGGRLRKVFSAAGIIFKGSGFYRNDSRAAAKSSSNGSSKSSESTGSESKNSESTSSDSKGSSKGTESKGSGSKDSGSKGSGGGSSSSSEKVA